MRPKSSASTRRGLLAMRSWFTDSIIDRNWWADVSPMSESVVGAPSVFIFSSKAARAAFGSEVPIEPEVRNGLDRLSAAQCQHIRAVSVARVDQVRGNVGPTVLTRIRDVLGLILDIPS